MDIAVNFKVQHVYIKAAYKKVINRLIEPGH